MRIRELTIENFRKFRQPITLRGFSDGLNLVCEPNESGKSTVLDALRAALFERHGSKSDRIRSFRPYGDEVAPAVGLTFEIGGEVWSLKKRFLQGASVSLEGPSGRFQSDAAEEKLQSLLGFVRASNRGADNESRGALGLLWVEQGLWSLGVPGQAARKTLEDVLAGEVGAVTGGRRTTAVVQAIDKAFAEVLTPTGKPTRALQAAEEALEAAQTARVEADDELAAYEGLLTRLEARRNELRRLLRDIEDPEAVAQGAALDQDLARARTAAQELRAARLLAEQAGAERKRQELRESARARLRTELKAAEVARDEATAAQAAHQEDVARARLTETDAAAALVRIRETLREAETARDASLAAQAQDERRSRLRAAFSRLDQATPIATQVEKLRERLAANPFTAKVLDELEGLERAVEQARAAADAGAAALRIELDPRTDAAQLNGRPLAESSTALNVTAPVTLALPGVATVHVEPPASGEAAQARLRAAERARAEGLSRLGAATIAAARQIARARADDEQALGAANARLAAICIADPGLEISDGYLGLRAALADVERPAAIEAPHDGEVPPALDEAAFQTLRAKERGAAAAWEAALAALQTFEIKQVGFASETVRSAGDVDRLAQDLRLDLERGSDAQLQEELQTAVEAEARATVDLAAVQRAAGGLDEADLGRKKEAWSRRVQKLQDDRIDLLQEIARLEVEAKTLGGAGPATRAQTAAEEVEFARAAFNRLREEADTLKLLKGLIAEAQTEAARRYLAPVKNRVQPYVARLLPATDLAFGEDYRPRMVVRRGREEPTDDLSKGTQEQLAVLTRLAFADLLVEKGSPASLVLDDALVFADDDRFEIMTEILSDAAKRMQVIILSCRASAYRRVDANRINIG